jgi:hypothetical protein
MGAIDALPPRAISVSGHLLAYPANSHSMLYIRVRERGRDDVLPCLWVVDT